MKYFIPTTRLLFILLTFNLSAQQISSDSYNKSLIHEEFNQETEHFKIITTTDNYFILDNGDYLLSRNNESSEYALIAKNSLATNFILKTVIRIGPNSNKKASLGIILKAQQDGKGAIIFEINKKGEYRVKQLIKNTYKTLSGNKKNKGWVKNKIVNQVDENNLIEIRTENNIYDVYINSQYLTTFFIPDYTNGSCGLIISPATKARVSYYYLYTKGKGKAISSYTNEDTKSINATIEELNKRIKTLEESNEKLNALNSESKENKNVELATTTKEQERRIENLNKTIDGLKNNAAKAKELEAINQSDIKAISDLKSENTALDRKIKELNNQITNSEKRNTDLKSTNLEKERKIKELNDQITNSEKRNTDLKSTNLEKERKILSLNKTLNDLKKDAAKAKEELQASDKSNTEVISNLESKNTTLDNKITELNNRLTSTQTKNTTLESINLKQKKEIKSLTNSYESLQISSDESNTSNQEL
ncbi:hypothetical protein OAK24_02505, partial [Flavobacteriales bacterium]|nr:hypothetical protein [Flavobacteriales bacterium]